MTAPTGSGKTGAFVVPAAALLLKKKQRRKTSQGPRVAILAPTRELVAQISREARRLIEGAKVASPPFDALAACDVAVSTPAPLLEALKQSKKVASSLEMVVVDEADKLLDLAPKAAETTRTAPNAFLKDVDAVLETRPEGCITGLFSATMSDTVKALAASVLRPGRCVVTVLPALGPPLVEQKLAYVGEDRNKIQAFHDAVRSGFVRPPCLVFANASPRAQLLAGALAKLGLRADCLHGGRSNADRDAVLRDFRSGKLWFLVATDVAARGLDLKALKSVVNLDAPKAPADYVHRVGRVGRNGHSGTALTLYTSDDAADLRGVANIAKQTGCADVPPWLLAKTTRKSWAAAALDPEMRKKQGQNHHHRKRPRRAPEDDD